MTVWAAEKMKSDQMPERGGLFMEELQEAHKTKVSAGEARARARLQVAGTGGGERNEHRSQGRHGTAEVAGNVRTLAFGLSEMSRFLGAVGRGAMWTPSCPSRIWLLQ